MKYPKKNFRAFFIIWCGEFLSNIGTGMTLFALVIYVFEQTSTATSASLITLAAFSPMILLSPFAGVLADRYDRRLLMLIGDGMSIVGLLLILYFYIIGRLSVFIIVIGLLINSIFISLLEPAYKATVTDLVDEKDYSKASGLLQIASSAKYIVSPVLAGLCLTFFELDVILLFDISTICITIFNISKKSRGCFTNRYNFHGNILYRICADLIYSNAYRYSG